jgi:hypothetical protein
MGDESGDETAIKLPVRNERQCRRLLVLGFLSEPAHSGMQPALPIPVETLAPPFYSVAVNWRPGDGKNQAPTSLRFNYLTITTIFQ